MKIRHNHRNSIKASTDMDYASLKGMDFNKARDILTKDGFHEHEYGDKDDNNGYDVFRKGNKEVELTYEWVEGERKNEAHAGKVLNVYVDEDINAACGKKKSVKAAYGGWGKFYGLNDVEFTVPNDTDDPTIFYNGKYYNYYDIEDTLWDYYKEECAENGVKPDENDFENWVANNSYYVYDLLDEVSPKSEPGRGVYRKKANTLRGPIKGSTITAAADVTNLKILIEGTGWVEVYEDSYEQGEGAYVNSWDFDIAGTYDTMQEVVDAIANATGASNDIRNYIYIDGRIDTDMEQNAEGYEPSDAEYEAWKRGEETLYLAHIGVSLKVTSDTHEMTEEEAEGFGLSIY